METKRYKKVSGSPIKSKKKFKNSLRQTTTLTSRNVPYSHKAIFPMWKQTIRKIQDTMVSPSLLY